jgi:PadR family transcriptional regulator PadR
MFCPSGQNFLDIFNTSRYDVYCKEGYIVDIQLKRGLLDVCVLAAIKDGESYGYKIIKDMKPYMELSESTLYTILKRLETANMLTVRTAEHGGRLRKYYRITEGGLQRIEEFKEDWKEILSIYRFVTKEDGIHD